ncbi:hypothetical protein [Actinoplanes xinjiangensis]|uniref:hypothetical protein n=1 Tax=Actinoplanes xinjiangensis TaxID=512350 RepID=UPI00343680D5
MKKLARMLTMGGFGLLTALAVGAGPVQATPGGTVPVTTPGPRHIELREDVQIAGYYRTESSCKRSGWFGERNAHWDVYQCDRVRVGYRRGAWALQAASYDDWNRLGFGIPLSAVCDFPAQYRPVWVGQFRPGRPGWVRPARPYRARPHHGRPHHGHPGPAHQLRERAGFGSVKPVTPVPSGPRNGAPVRSAH